MTDLKEKLIESIVESAVDRTQREKEEKREQRQREQMERMYTEIGFWTAWIGFWLLTVTYFILFVIEKADTRKSDDRTNAIYFFGILWVADIPWLIYFMYMYQNICTEFRNMLALRTTKVFWSMIFFFTSLCFFLVIMFENYGLLPVLKYDCVVRV